MLHRALGSVFLLVPTLCLFEIAGRLAAEQRAGRGMGSEPGVGQDLRESVDGMSRQASEDVHGVHEGIDVGAVPRTMRVRSGGWMVGHEAWAGVRHPRHQSPRLDR